MKNFNCRLLLALILLVASAACLPAQQLPGAARIQAAYQKTEVSIPMRDGVKLHTAIYTPRDTSQKWPIMLRRTPYSSAPYGAEAYSPRIGPSPLMEDQKYIFVSQDVRGRFMSQGKYNNMRPNVDDEKVIDESSDTYDTIDWLVKRVRNNNGKVGMWGISYPGFYCPPHCPIITRLSWHRLPRPRSRISSLMTFITTGLICSAT